MPLTDLIRYFNVADTAGESTLYVSDERVFAWHNGLHLGSLFQPIVDLRQERIVGHQALLSARHENGRVLDSDQAYALCETPEAVIHFDRLNRTLHALNFLAQRRHTGGYLQLAVHPRHLKAVQSQHGLVYEAILKRCGLGPEDIVLEIDAREFRYNRHLGDALANYRQRGYRLALDELPAATDKAALLALRPDIAKLPLEDCQELLEQARRLSITVELGGIETGQDLAKAGASGAELGKGGLFGLAQINCRPTHSGQRLAYNSPSPSGAAS